MLQMLEANAKICRQLCFEITETAAISNIDTVKDFIKKLGQLGCRFALDDFGSGLSSFAYLQTLPVDFIKIDGQFVRDVGSNPVNQAIIRAVHDIGTAMEKLVIAEFVEDQQSLNVLSDIGVEFAQGYGIEKPKRLSEYLVNVA